MSKKVIVQTIEQNGDIFGQVSNPQDLIKAQDFLHDRISDLTRDFLNHSKPNEIIGFPSSLGVDNYFNVNTPGRIYALGGKSYDLLANVSILIPPSDDNFSRLDLIVAVLEDDVDANLALIPFVQLRTNVEFANAVPPYPPNNINVATEKHNRAVVQIKTGTPSETPAIPAVNSNEVPLYLIAVAPGATSIREADVADLRDTISTLRRLNERTRTNQLDLSDLRRRVEDVEELASRPIDINHVFGEMRTLGDILAELRNQFQSVRSFPEIIYDNPRVPLTNPDSSKIMAAGDLESGVPVVNIELGARINFGDTEVVVRPDKFADADVNARFFQVVPTPANTQQTSNLSLSDVTQIAADGFTDFVERASIFTVARARPGAAARNSQFIEIFGGLAQNNTDHLSDWLTYDIINDTLTPRTPTTLFAESDRPAVMPCGDGENLLVIAGNTNNSTPRCYKINAVTGVLSEILTEKPTGVQFFGDLIAPNIIFIVALRKEINGVETDFWEFDTTANIFTQVGTTGNVPACDIDHAHGCYFQPNQFLLVKFTPNVNGSGQTFIFDRASLNWTLLSISQPYGQTVEIQTPLSRFRLANVNGRPLLVGGLLTKETDPQRARIWEFKQSAITTYAPDRYRWQFYETTFPPLQEIGFCSTLVNNVPSGSAFMFAGHGRFSDAKSRIYASVQGGLIATYYKGQPAITIGDTSSFATFVVNPYTAPWDVAGYMLSLVGQYTRANLQVEVSFNNGATYEEILPEKFASIDDSSTPGTRLLRFTFYNFRSSKPVLAGMHEIFDEDGGELETRVVFRYDAPTVQSALYIDRNGLITISETVEPSTPDKCLLHKIVPLGSGVAPFVKNYINRRRPHVKYSKIISTADETTIQLENELAVPIRYQDARGIDGSTELYYKVDIRDIAFDENFQLSELAEKDGDTWVVELEG